MRTALQGMIAKELRQTFRDRRLAGMMVMAPLLQLIVLGFAVNLEVEEVPTLVADEDRTIESDDLLSGLLAGDAFTDVGEVDNGDQALRMLSHGEALVAMVVPRGYARDVADGKPAHIQVLVDGSDTNRAISSQNAISAYVLSRSIARARERFAQASGRAGQALSTPALRVEPRIYYNPTLDSQVFFVPGVAATLLLVITMVVSAMGLAREKESGTLEQVMVTPIGTTTLVLGKTIPYAMIGLVDLGLVVGAGAWIFGVPIRGHLWILVLAGLLYLMTTLGWGLMISSLARTQQQAFMTVTFFLLPAIMLSGFMTPIDNMPSWLQPVTAFNPVRHFVEIMRMVLLKGSTVRDVGPQLVALAGIGIGFFSIAIRMMRRRLS